MILSTENGFIYDWMIIHPKENKSIIIWFADFYTFLYSPIKI